jgi:hypothetical protein
LKGAFKYRSVETEKLGFGVNFEREHQIDEEMKDRGKEEKKV